MVSLTLLVLTLPVLAARAPAPEVLAAPVPALVLSPASATSAQRGWPLLLPASSCSAVLAAVALTPPDAAECSAGEGLLATGAGGSAVVTVGDAAGVPACRPIARGDGKGPECARQAPAAACLSAAAENGAGLLVTERAPEPEPMPAPALAWA